MTAVAARKSGEVPGWIYNVVLPLINLLVALLVSGLLIAIIGENPLDALFVMAAGAVGYFDPSGLGYTLYYATSLIFTGLGFSIAHHAGLFNIGGEGQAYIGGLGVGLVCLTFTGMPWPVVALLAIVGGAVFGGAWGFMPGWLAAKRGSHTVITTIMFNFIAASIMTYLMVDVLIRPGQQSPESMPFAASGRIPQMHTALAALGIHVEPSPWNISFLFALLCCVGLYVFLWKTRWGYALRTVGQNERAAVYAGISPATVTMVAMSLSGALAGMVALNVLMGDQGRIILNFTGGLGFIGIAVSLMGRNHPVGIVFAALLFGALYQGGAELSYEFTTLNKDLVVVIQGLVILFTGALEGLFKPQLEALWRSFARRMA
jgi:general nucleoside transport system permease protein